MQTGEQREKKRVYLRLGLIFIRSVIVLFCAALIMGVTLCTIGLPKTIVTRFLDLPRISDYGRLCCCKMAKYGLGVLGLVLERRGSEIGIKAKNLQISSLSFPSVENAAPVYIRGAHVEVPGTQVPSLFVSKSVPEITFQLDFREGSWAVSAGILKTEYAHLEFAGYIEPLFSWQLSSVNQDESVVDIEYIQSCFKYVSGDKWRGRVDFLLAEDRQSR